MKSGLCKKNVSVCDRKYKETSLFLTLETVRGPRISYNLYSEDERAALYYPVNMNQVRPQLQQQDPDKETASVCQSDLHRSSRGSQY